MPKDLDELRTALPSEIENQPRQLGNISLIDHQVEITRDAMRELPGIADGTEVNPVRFENTEKAFREFDAPPLLSASGFSCWMERLPICGSAQASARRTHKSMTAGRHVASEHAQDGAEKAPGRDGGDAKDAGHRSGEHIGPEDTVWSLVCPQGRPKRGDRRGGQRDEPDKPGEIGILRIASAVEQVHQRSTEFRE